MDSLPHIFFVAPMAEITTPALRHIIKEFCPDIMLFSEMLNAGAIVSRAAHNKPLIDKSDFENPFIYQIAGSSPEVMRDACALLSDKGCYSIDINMGCSAPEITKKGYGAKLLADINIAKNIIKACRKTSKSKLSVKMRTGFETYDEKNFINFIKMFEYEGVDFITIHARYAKLSFKRSADWNLIKLAKRSVHIPIIGNGDITSPEMGIQKREETGCDGIMIGREAVKSPWIFKLCYDLFYKKSYSIEIDIQHIFIKTLDYMKKYLPENLHQSRCHRFCFYFSKNLKFSHDLFTKIRRENNIEAMKTIINEYFNRNPNEKIQKIFSL